VLARESGPLRERIDRSCRQCGYGIAMARLPAQCPMCRGSSWAPIRRIADPELDAAAAVR